MAAGGPHFRGVVFRIRFGYNGSPGWNSGEEGAEASDVSFSAGLGSAVVQGKRRVVLPSEGPKRRFGGQEIQKKKKRGRGFRSVEAREEPFFRPIFPLLPPIAYSINFHDNFVKF